MDAAAWDERYAASELVWSAGPNAFVVEQVVAHLSDRVPGRAIDLAAARGATPSGSPSRAGRRSSSSSHRSRSRRRRPSRTSRDVTLTTTLADVTAESDIAPADLVLVCYLQLPSEPLACALAHAASLVAPGGQLLIIAHERDNLAHGYGGPPDPAFLPTVAEVLSAIEGQGLDVAEARQVHRPVDTEAGPREAIDLLVRASRPDATRPA